MTRGLQSYIWKQVTKVIVTFRNYFDPYFADIYPPGFIARSSFIAQTAEPQPERQKRNVGQTALA